MLNMVTHFFFTCDGQKRYLHTSVIYCVHMVTKMIPQTLLLSCKDVKEMNKLDEQVHKDTVANYLTTSLCWQPLKQTTEVSVPKLQSTTVTPWKLSVPSHYWTHLDSVVTRVRALCPVIILTSNEQTCGDSLWFKAITLLWKAFWYFSTQKNQRI